MLSLSDADTTTTVAERASVRRSLVAYAVWVFASALGGTIGLAAPAGHMEPALRHLLWFMAFCKTAAAVASLLLVQWRIASDIRSPLLSGYLVAVALMAAAATMMWQLAHLLAAGVLFHTGLLLLLGLAYVDRGARVVMLDTWKVRSVAWKRGYL